MANWSDAKMEIVLPKENKEKFLNLFLEWDNEEKNNSKDRYFARTYITEILQEREVANKDDLDITKVDIKLRLTFSCAWSVRSCWIEGYPNNKTCPTIEQICDELDVKKLTVQSSVLGIYFVEKLHYNENANGIIYESQELDKDLFIEWLGRDEWDDFCYYNEYDNCQKAYEIYTKNYYDSHNKDSIPICYDEFYNNEWQDEVLKEYYLGQIKQESEI